MLKFPVVFEPTRKRDAGRQRPDRILARLKSPFPYGRRIKTGKLTPYKYVPAATSLVVSFNKKLVLDIKKMMLSLLEINTSMYIIIRLTRGLKSYIIPSHKLGYSFLRSHIFKKSPSGGHLKFQ